jgi:ribose transport system ATP-binding protein
MTGDNVLLKIENIHKSYAAPAVCDVSLEIRKAEVHAVVGENGAGKSTLCRIIAGVVKPDSGRMFLNNLLYQPLNKRDAERNGVRMVMQELNVIPTLTVAENIFFTDLPNRFGVIDQKLLYENSVKLLNQVGLGNIAPDTPVLNLSIAQQQLVEIAAGLSKNCTLLILDEPTASLTESESETLFKQVEKLKSAGTAIIYVSHRLEEVMKISDTITVLRDGRLVSTKRAGDYTINEIIRLMVGRELEDLPHKKQTVSQKILMRVEGITTRTGVKEVSFELKEGEVLGFAGLMGSGRTELMRAIFGADRRESGNIFLRGSDKPVAINSPKDAVEHGIAMLPENRKEQGLFLPLSLKINITINNLKMFCIIRGLIRQREEVHIAEQWRRTLSIKSNSIEQTVRELSGGNQQKVLLARWLLKNCDILIMDEPTRGIDVGAKFEIYKLVSELAEQGKGVIFVSSDLKELFTVCDRIAVMSSGKLAATFKRGEWTQDRIMAAAVSGYLKESKPAN